VGPQIELRIDSQPFNSNTQMAPITRGNDWKTRGTRTGAESLQQGFDPQVRGSISTLTRANVPDNTQKRREKPALGRFIPRWGTRQGEEQPPSIRKEAAIQDLRRQVERAAVRNSFCGPT